MSENRVSEIVKNLPLNPGVYIMYNSDGKIIYIGKAKSLKKRVSQYFLKDRDAKTTALVSHIANIEYIITGNEYEALILENNLIKKHKPKYNIDLKDGKTYQMIRISKERFPKIFKTRRLVGDGSEYFGPFPKGFLLDSYMELISNLYPLRRCSVPLKMKKTPCLYYHIGKCSAPCSGKISEEDYRKHIVSARHLLEGQTESLREELTKEMKEESRKLNFEAAAKKRDLIKAIDMISSPQVMQINNEESNDYIALASIGTLYSIAIMSLRSGSLVGKATYRVETFATADDVLLNFMLEYYDNSRDLPECIYVSENVDVELLVKYFSEHLKNVRIEIPLDGKHYRALRLAEQNAKDDVAKCYNKEDNMDAVVELQKILGLEEPPLLIEGYDIAELHGKYTVASLISFKDGKANKDGYRRFNIKSLDGKIDDFGSMREAITRRYTRVIEENLERPDLVMVDGGQGQVNVAREVLDELGLADIPVVGLAKEIETIVFDDDREDLVLPHTNKGLRLLIAIRDECHRFCTTANQNQRSSDAHFKLLCSINGMGEKRAKSLMTEYRSIDNIIKTSSAEIAKTTHIPVAVVERVQKELSV